MNILAPANNAKEIPLLAEAGANEVYCGVISRRWKELYSSVASPNRREWSSANMEDYEALKLTVNAAHQKGLSVWFVLNAFYTPGQEEIIKEEVVAANDAGVDGFIVADIGMMDFIQSKIRSKVIVSTCATTFNSWTAKFYKKFSAMRITLPRQLTLNEIKQIAASNPDIGFEVFVLNSGCKNIDGFCTFHHGVSELQYPGIWNICKKMNLDVHLLEAIRQYPKLFNKVTSCISGVDSACILDYDIEVKGLEDKRIVDNIKKNLKRNFSLYTGVDPCRACEIMQLVKLKNLEALKIVGRNYATSRKVKDIKYIKAVWGLVEQYASSEKDFEEAVKKKYKEIYKYPCGEICYHK